VGRCGARLEIDGRRKEASIALFEGTWELKAGKSGIGGTLVRVFAKNDAHVTYSDNEIVPDREWARQKRATR
jgi:hypothetical protein